MKSVLITGCSAGGIGAAIATAFAEDDSYQVFATARTISKVDEDLSRRSNVEVLSLDVSDADSIAKAAAFVLEKTNGRLDVLINNAGLNYTSPVLDVSLDDAKKLFNTNFWGVISVSQAFASALVKAAGVVVNVSSIAAVLHTPFSAIYSASKAALTIMSETLRLEMAPLGVAVVTIAAGNVNTQFWQKEADYALPPDSMYRRIEKDIAVAASGKHAGDHSNAKEFASQIRSLCLARASGVYWEGKSAGLVKWASKFMPISLMDYILSDSRGLETLQKLQPRKKSQ